MRLLLTLALLLPWGAAADDALPSGTRIYREGIGSAPLTARLASAGRDMPARLFPCVNCHKADGLGQREGGLQPSDITWPTLTRPAAEGGRGYDEAALARAIREGTDPSGRALGAAMPRYHIEDADLVALTGFLHSLDTASPGVSGEEIVVAALLPLEGQMAEAARLVERFLNLAVLDINTRKRFEGRRITLVSVPFAAERPGDAVRAVQRQITERPPFCFIATLGLTPEDAAFRMIAEAGIPHLAPLVAPNEPDDRSAVFVEPSVRDQARALLSLVADREGAPLRLGVVAGHEPADHVAAEAVAVEARRRGLVIESMDADVAPATIVAHLQAERAGVLLGFMPQDAVARLLGEAARRNWRPILLGRRQQLGGLDGNREIARAADIYLATSYGGVDPRSRGAFDFRRISGELGGRHPELLRDSYVGVRVLDTVLGRIGRQLTRERFRQALEGVRDLEVGVMAPLSFDRSASRRDAVAVMRLDPDRARLAPLTEQARASLAASLASASSVQASRP